MEIAGALICKAGRFKISGKVKKQVKQSLNRISLIFKEGQINGTKYQTGK
jgi:hypothetical protein